MMRYILLLLPCLLLAQIPVQRKSASIDSMSIAIQKYVDKHIDTVAETRYKRDFITLNGDTIFYYIRSSNYYDNEAMVRVFMLVKELQTRIERLEWMVDYLYNKEEKK